MIFILKLFQEAILKNGAFVLRTRRSSSPSFKRTRTALGYVVINSDGSTDGKYADGKSVLETVYAGSHFKHEDPDFNPENLPALKIQSLFLQFIRALDHHCRLLPGRHPRPSFANKQAGPVRTLVQERVEEEDVAEERRKGRG